MPLRLIFGLRIGPPQACFRIAFRPGPFTWTDGFRALERTAAETVSFLTTVTPDRRMRLLSGEEPPPESLLPRLGARVGASDVYGDQTPDGTINLLVRTSFRLRFWPLGEWVVFDGLHIAADNASRPHTGDELAEAW